MATRDQIVELLNRRSAASAARDAAAIAATHDENGIVVSPFGGVQEGREEIERVYRLWFAAFPDAQFKYEEPIIEGDRAVQIATLTATHTGEFFGLAPTGRHMEVQAALLLKFENGFVKEERRIYDFTGLLVQIGVLKAKPGA